jgi:hypothetical protein
VYIHNTHAHVLCVIIMIALCHSVFNEQFYFCPMFLLVNFITPILSGQPRLVAHREIPGAVPVIWADRI